MIDLIDSYFFMIRDFRNYRGTVSVHQFWNSFFSIFIIGAILFVISEFISLIIFLINLTTNMRITLSTASILFPIFAIITLIGLFPQMIRRLRDANHSSYYLLWIFVPIIGWIFLTMALLETNL
ncbi:MAG: DUF805 domain-containing protein [Bacilli bacterium]|nr:DUF805 domain-containing protein [Bacilli bacterium]